MPRLTEILIAVSPTAPPLSQPTAHAIPGRGLVGDRYYLGCGTFSPHPPKPDSQLTLIQLEHIEAFAQSTGLSFTAADSRRNLVTVGIDLTSLVGREFYIGPVLLRGLRLCEPCHHLAKQTHQEVLRGFVHKGGLRAQILTEGQITVGDTLVVTEH